MVSIAFLCFFSGIAFSFAALIMFNVMPERYDILFDKAVDIAIALFLTSVLSYWYEKKKDAISKVYEYVSNSENYFLDALKSGYAYADQLHNLEEAIKYINMASERANHIRNKKILRNADEISRSISSCIELLNSQQHDRYVNQCSKTRNLFRDLINRILNL